MKAEYEYSEEEVLAIVLENHSARVTPPTGTVWSPRFQAYSSKNIIIEAVEKEPEGGAS